jgi:hypothetical protein
MKFQNYITFYLISFSVLFFVSKFQSAPGYMDADYYLMTGGRLANGLGFTEEVLWNFLDDPSGLPHPSHAYWMPLPTLIAATGIKLLGKLELPMFETGKILFILIAATISPLTVALTWKLSSEKRLAFFSGALAIFPVFYLAFLSTTDTFALSMVLGAVFFFLIEYTTNEMNLPICLFLLGVVAGLLHLNRAEGFIWIAIATASLILGRNAWRQVLWIISGYALIMAPWLLRNQISFGSLIPQGAFRTLWLTEYDQLFTYPASQLSPNGWLASGFAEIIQTRIESLWLNLQTAVAVQGGILLAPLIVLGAWRKRKIPAILWAGVAWVFLLLMMTVLFPFSGSRGGFFHAAAALQPTLWALAAVGLNVLVGFGARKRGWRQNQAFSILGVGAVLILIGFSSFLIRERVVGDESADPIWDDYFQRYETLGEALESLDLDADAVSMVNNPPGFNLATGWKAISVPNGDLDVSLEAARRYGASLLLLDENHPAGLDSLYSNPRNLRGLIYIESVSDTHIFQIALP